MADIYTDFATGDDTTGLGTMLLPYKTITKAVSVANGGDTIWLSNSAAYVLTTSIIWAGFGSITPISSDVPLAFKPWNNGGSITISLPTGNILAAEINGNSAVTSIFSTSSQPQYVSFEAIKIHGSTGVLITPGNYWNFYHCEFYGSAGTYMINGSTAINQSYIECIFRDDGGSGVDLINTGTTTYISGCYFTGASGYAIRATGNTLYLINNIVKTGIEGGMLISADSNTVMNNTIIGSATASIGGLQMTSSSERSNIYNNLITDFTGTSATGIKFDAGSNAFFVGYNSFYNNTSNMTGTLIKGVDLTANDITESSTPYVNAAGSNWALAAGALSRQAGLPRGFPNTSTLDYTDIGGAQAVASGGSTGTVGAAYAS